MDDQIAPVYSELSALIMAAVWTSWENEQDWTANDNILAEVQFDWRTGAFYVKVYKPESDRVYVPEDSTITVDDSDLEEGSAQLTMFLALHLGWQIAFDLLFVKAQSPAIASIAVT